MFRVLMVAQGRNTYAAWVLGRIQPADNGSRISVRFTLHPVAIIAVLGIFVWPQALSFAKGAGISVEWALAFLAFHMVMYYFGFAPEAQRAERVLRELADEQAAAIDERQAIEPRARLD